MSFENGGQIAADTVASAIMQSVPRKAVIAPASGSEPSSTVESAGASTKQRRIDFSESEFTGLHKDGAVAVRFFQRYGVLFLLYILDSISRQMVYEIMPLKIMFVFRRDDPAMYYATTMCIFTARVFWGMFIDTSPPVPWRQGALRRRWHIIIGYFLGGLFAILMGRPSKNYNTFLVICICQAFFLAWGTAARDGAVFELTSTALADNTYVQSGVQLSYWLGTALGTLFYVRYDNRYPDRVISGMSAFLFLGSAVAYLVPERDVVRGNAAEAKYIGVNDGMGEAIVGSQIVDAEKGAEISDSKAEKVGQTGWGGERASAALAGRPSALTPSLTLPATARGRAAFLWSGLKEQCGNLKFLLLEIFIFLVCSIPGCDLFDTLYVNRVFHKSKLKDAMTILQSFTPIVGGVFLFLALFYIPRCRTGCLGPFALFCAIILAAHACLLAAALLWLPILAVNESGNRPTTGTLVLCVLSTTLQGLGNGWLKLTMWIMAALSTSRLVPSAGWHVMWLMNDIGYEMRKEMARPFKFKMDVPERRIRVFLLHIYAMVVVPLIFLPCLRFRQKWPEGEVDAREAQVGEAAAAVPTYGDKRSPRLTKSLWKKIVDF